MKNFLLILVIVFTVINYPAFSREKGGGVIVGNGAGIVETNFQFAFHSLGSILQSCIKNTNCSLQPDEIIIAESIINIVKKNADKKDRFVFVSEKLNPGFFTTSDSEMNRIAKTGLDSSSTIFINADMLYLNNGAPALSFQSILALIIHELGHQSGIRDHASLDILGVKVADFSENLTSHYGYKVESNKSILFSVTNFDQPIKSTIFIFNWKNEKSQDLSNTLAASSSCKYDSESYSGIEVSNGHFSFDGKNNLVFNAWVNVLCHESFSGSIFVYKKSLIVTMDGQFNILNLLVE
ncbi:MAG: hypothetical protein WC635_17155 [Bacteriovorax sp.]|jgi:hypothetical protein